MATPTLPTTARSIADRLVARANDIQSLACVGLDPVLDRLPTGVSRDPAGVTAFLTEIVEATAPYALAYKPNLGFFVALGRQGLDVLYAVREAIPAEIPVILDGKINDMGLTAEHYAKGFFDELDIDLLTIAPYMGEDAIAPYMQDPERGVLILAKNSNPGSGQLQDRLLDTGRTLAMEVAHLAHGWNETYPASVGLVVGATYPEVFRDIRSEFPDGWLLVPGIGEQGGSLEDSLRSGLNGDGYGVLASASRSVLYAGQDADFATRSADAAADLARRTWEVRAATLGA
jgi:orotidine 5'-phosphate decarboxylase subfamily 2